MATRTPKIPQSIWGRHKNTILSLYLTSDLTLDELAQTMDKHHGFPATVSQFEAQLKAWNARKNLKRHEWEGILKKIDSLAAQGVQSRVIISGHPISMDRVNRARRYCKGESHSKKRRRAETDLDDVTNEPGANNVFIETEDQDGNWSRYTTLPDTSVISHQRQMSSSAVLGLDTHGQPVQTSDEHVEQVHNGSADYHYYENIDLPRVTNTSPQLSSFNVPDLTFEHWLTADENENVIQSMDLSFAFPEAQVPQFSNQHDPFANIAPPSLDLVNRLPPADLAALGQFSSGAMYLKDLLFERFERELELRRLTLAIHPSPTQDSGFLSSALKLTTIFIADAAAAMTKVNGRSLRENSYNAALTLQTLNAIVPRAQPECGENSMPQSQQEITGTELYRLLLFSTANGFIGLDGVPIKTVLRFLRQNSNLTSLLSQMFRVCPGHVAKSLAENLFRAAIESGDDQVVRLLLKSRLVDVNNTFCFSEGEKHTPIQRAAKLQRFGVVQELLRSGADVNEKQSDSGHSIYCRSVLGCLIDGTFLNVVNVRNHNTFSSKYLETVDTLIEAGAEVHISFIQVALTRFTRMELAKKLIPKLAPSRHSGYFDKDILGSTVNELSEEDAKGALEKILSDCENVGCKQCLSRFSNSVNWAIVRGAKRGYIQFVRSFFCYAKSPTQILSAAIRGGNRKLIEFILAQNPNIRQDPAEDIGAYTTPLAEAIEARDSALVEILRERGAFENLDNTKYSNYTSRFGVAISAAASAGDVECVKKLLSHSPRISGQVPSSAIIGAIRSQREDIVQILLHAGTTGYIDTSEIDQCWDKICKWGNKTITTLMANFGGNSALQNAGAFNFCYESSRLQRDALTRGLRVAVERADSIMFQRCLDGGADAMDNETLENVAKWQLDMLQVLLKHIPQTKTYIHRLGTDAVKKVITQGRPDALEMLLNCRAIDFKSTIGRDAPIATAIKQEAASRCCDFPLTTRLLDAGCDINGVVATYDRHLQRNNLTPLLVAIETGNNDLVKFLIDRGADVNKDAAYGIRQTPLQAAAKKGRLDIVELLLRNGADINGKPAMFSGGTALQCAAMGGNCNIAVLLLEQGASLGTPPSMFDGRWPLEGAAEYGRLDMIQFLWNVSFADFPIEQCRKAMKLAEEKGHGACKDLILELATTFGIMPTLEESG
ncbi:ankyrin [Hypoxylon sp. EC38]|nr:ankyrin [Hypoxylon sp. EC38]